MQKAANSVHNHHFTDYKAKGLILKRLSAQCQPKVVFIRTENDFSAYFESLVSSRAAVGQCEYHIVNYQNVLSLFQTMLRQFRGVSAWADSYGIGLTQCCKVKAGSSSTRRAIQNSGSIMVAVYQRDYSALKTRGTV